MMIKNNKANQLNKKTSVIFYIVCTALILSMSSVAYAGGAVWDIGTHNLLRTLNAIEGMNQAYNQSIATILATNFGPAGNGFTNQFIESNTNAVMQLAQSNKQAIRNAVREMNARNNMRDAQKKFNRRIADPYGSSCAQVSYTSSRQKGLQGTDTNNSSEGPIAINQKSHVNDSGSSKKQREQTTIKHRKNGNCSAFQAKNHIDGCKKEGSMPNGDRKTSSMTNGSTKPNKPTNQSLTPKQAATASMYTKKIVTPEYPAQVDPSQADTAAGIHYSQLRDQYIARANAGLNALKHIVAMSSQPQNKTQAKTAGQNWQKNVPPQKYHKIFPNKKYPKVPSERTVLNYEIASDYANNNPMGMRTSEASKTTQESLHQLVQMKATSDYVNWLLLKRIKDLNTMMAAMLGQQLNPTTYNDVQSAKNKIDVNHGGNVNSKFKKPSKSNRSY